MIEIVKQGTKFDFMGKAKWFFVISGLIVAASLALIFTKGFNYGIDFAGGTIIQVKFQQAPSLNKIRSELKSVNIGDAIIQNFGSDKDILIRVEKNDKDLKFVQTSIETALKQGTDNSSFEIVRVDQVGPQVGADLKKATFYAVIYSIIAVLIYVAIRFKLIYAAGAILALVHDVIITLGFFSLTGKEISISVIAAVLTLVGYSLNDTIVVFDRIREHIKQGHHEGKTLKDIMNISLNETLSRTILTSLLTLLTVISLFVFGGEIINGFSFALLVGIIVGTYSSIGIASALVYLILKDAF